jgi:hypothetical protein
MAYPRGERDYKLQGPCFRYFAHLAAEPALCATLKATTPFDLRAHVATTMLRLRIHGEVQEAGLSALQEAGLSVLYVCL